jgi:hypothetical protein
MCESKIGLHGKTLLHVFVSIRFELAKMNGL